jgi:hypothetical protein
MENTELNNVQLKIKQIYTKIEAKHFDVVIGDYVYEEYETKEHLNQWFRESIKTLHYLIQVYLELKQMPLFLKTFKEKFDNLIEDDEKIIAESQYFIEGEAELILLFEYKRFLEPFDVLTGTRKANEDYNRVINLLNNTGAIISHIEKITGREEDVYNEIKWVLELYYPTTRGGRKDSFPAATKKYNADILIPEIQLAIEYKYIDNTTKKIDDFIDEIKTDANNYKDNLKYKRFVGVLYITDKKIATEAKIKAIWNEKKFPTNWELIICFGK